MRVITGMRMVIDKKFDTGRVLSAIHDICNVSEFLDPAVGRPSRAAEIERYLWLGRQRLAVVLTKFTKLGYKALTQNFNFGGHKATNAIFSRGDISNASLLFAGHHDYCAGVGAEDNATALALMEELARCLSEEESRVAFASFDLEELGLLGSRHFAQTMSLRDLRRFAGVVALECLGSGEDVVICERVVGATSDAVLVSALRRAAAKTGHDALVKGFDWFNSDHVPFAERGVRTVEVCSYNSSNYRGGPSPDVNVAHSDLDTPHSILPTTLGTVGEMLVEFLAEWKE
jgi:uncharacterized protein with GYD domain